MIYTIQKGRHYSTHYLGMLFRFLTGWQYKHDLVARVTFSKECLTPSKDGDDINKLIGLGFGMDHHQHSVRVGWRADGEHIALYAYSYHNGTRSIELIGYVKPDRRWKIGICRCINNDYKIVLSKGGYRTVEYVFKPFPKQLLYKRLYPYFGGTYPAPETMKIKIEWL